MKTLILFPTILFQLIAVPMLALYALLRMYVRGTAGIDVFADNLLLEDEDDFGEDDLGNI